MAREVINKSKPAQRVHLFATRILRRALDRQELYVEAFEVAKKSLELANRVKKRNLLIRSNAANDYANSARKIGRHEEAEQVVRTTLAFLERDHPQSKFFIANTQFQLAKILVDLRQYDEAMELARSVVELQTINLGENDAYVVRPMIMLAKIQRLTGDLATAESIAANAVKRSNQLSQDQFRIRYQAYQELSEVLEKTDVRRAAAALDNAIKFLRLTYGNQLRVARGYLKLASFYSQIGELEKAATESSNAIKILELHADQQAQLDAAYQQNIDVLLQIGREEEAKKIEQKKAKLTKENDR